MSVRLIRRGPLRLADDRRCGRRRLAHMRSTSPARSAATASRPRSPCSGPAPSAISAPQAVAIPRPAVVVDRPAARLDRRASPGEVAEALAPPSPALARRASAPTSFISTARRSRPGARFHGAGRRRLPFLRRDLVAGGARRPAPAGLRLARGAARAVDFEPADALAAPTAAFAADDRATPTASAAARAWSTTAGAAARRTSRPSRQPSSSPPDGSGTKARISPPSTAPRLGSPRPFWPPGRCDGPNGAVHRARHVRSRSAGLARGEIGARARGRAGLRVRRALRALRPGGAGSGAGGLRARALPTSRPSASSGTARRVFVAAR